MNQVYIFEDWTSASKMKNVLDHDLKVDVGVVRSEDKSFIDGYQITVYNTCTDRIVYRFYVDYRACANAWCLNTDEAIEMLNQVGFPCEIRKVHQFASGEARQILLNLQGLGYTHVSRGRYKCKIKGCNISRIDIEVLNGVTGETKFLSEITDYRYQDFWYLTEVPTKISDLIS